MTTDQVPEREAPIVRRAMLRTLATWGSGALAGQAVLGAMAAAAPGHVLAQDSQPPHDLDVQSSGPVTSLLYRNPTLTLQGVTAKGAAGANAVWEQGKSAKWYIEEQRVGEVAAISGVITFDRALIDGALRIFDWGFARQAADGSFAGTNDLFHSTSFFVAAVAHAGLFMRAAARSGRFPLAAQYLTRFEPYTPRVQRAARWMVRPSVFRDGLARNAAYTHRRYLVGAALGLTGVLAGDQGLIDRVRPVLEEGLSRQQPDGVNPERGGHDSSYQMTGVVFAEYWAAYLPDHPLTPRIRAMIQHALTWEASRVLPSGEVSAKGNTRTAGQEESRTGIIKSVAYSRVIRGFASWAALTGSQQWAELAWRTGRYYFATPAFAARPLLP